MRNREASEAAHSKWLNGTSGLSRCAESFRLQLARAKATVQRAAFADLCIPLPRRILASLKSCLKRTATTSAKKAARRHSTCELGGGGIRHGPAQPSGHLALPASMDGMNNIVGRVEQVYAGRGRRAAIAAKLCG